MKTGELSEAQLKRVNEALDSVPYAKLIGIELETFESGTATLAFDVRDELKQNNGVVHGGAIASLIDTATAFAIISLLEPGEQTTTVDLTISYLKPLTEGRAHAVAKVLKSGRRLLVVSAELRDDGGNLAATALSTYIRI